jgi:hypothetical protein
MSPTTIASIIDSAIPFAAGVYAFVRGNNAAHRAANQSPETSEETKADWFTRNPNVARAIGIILMLFSFFMLVNDMSPHR